VDNEVKTSAPEPAAKPAAPAPKPAPEAPNYEFTVSVSPHVRAPENTRSIMLDVVIGLVPAMVAAVYFFGLRALCVLAVSVAASVFFEWGYRKLLKKDQTIGDCSAVVTGILLALVCPVTIPYWTIIIGDFFAIVIVKQLFGGIGQNFMNPALAGRAFLFSWPVIMTTWVVPGTSLNLIGSNVDAVTAATPMSYLSSGSLPAQSILSLFTGNVGGCMGETSAILLLLGGIYLLVRKVISPRIPVAYLATVAVIAFLFPQGNGRVDWMLCQLFGGGLMLGAFFMATDYATSPVTKLGQIVFGIGCGLITMFIRYFGSYAEGVSYAILIMNTTVFLLDKIGRPSRFGVVKAKGGDRA
jgi:electron transport complex protein RnfD